MYTICRTGLADHAGSMTTTRRVTAAAGPNPDTTMPTRAHSVRGTSLRIADLRCRPANISLADSPPDPTRRVANTLDRPPAKRA
jgi:hypothetical protein